MERARCLINYLMRSAHGSPFEHGIFQFYIDCPLFVAREWRRHRMASYNEYSMRYAEVPVDGKFYVPTWGRIPDPDNKQSSVIGPKEGYPESNIIAWHDAVKFSIKGSATLALNTYHELIRAGVAREMARIVLPVGMYTQFWFTVNARSLMNFLELRNAPEAQLEIQLYAEALETIFAERMPLTYQAFVINGRQHP